MFEKDKAEPDKYFYRIKLSDIDTHEVFYDKLTFLYLEMPKFDKDLEECESHFDKWLYLLKNLEELKSRPAKLQEKIFSKVLGEAEIAGFNQQELREYEENLKIYRDMQSVLDTARNEGRKEGERSGLVRGREEGRKDGREATIHELAGKLKKEGMEAKKIAELTGLSAEEVKKLEA